MILILSVQSQAAETPSAANAPIPQDDKGVVEEESYLTAATDHHQLAEIEAEDRRRFVDGKKYVYGGQEVTPSEVESVRVVRVMMDGLPKSQVEWMTDIDILRYLRHHGNVPHKEEHAFSSIKKALRLREKLDFAKIMEKDFRESHCHHEMLWGGRARGEY